MPVQSNHPLSIRLLTPGDAFLLQAIQLLLDEAFEESISAKPASDLDHLESMLAKDSFLAIAAIHGDEVVGAIVAYEIPRLERNASEIYLYDLAVSSSFRRQGIATAMIRELQRIAAQRQVRTIFVQAHLEDEPAIALYSKLGKRQDAAHFDIEPIR